jgi:hypothetical protein
MINDRRLWVLLIFAAYLANAAFSEASTDEPATLRYYARGNNGELIYQKSGEDSESVEIYEFRDNGEYATLQSEVVPENGGFTWHYRNL